MNIIEQIDTILGNPTIQWDTDENLFMKMADFIIDLDPEMLDDKQIQEVMDIIDLLDVPDVTEVKLAGKSSTDKKNYSRRYTRKNKTKIQSTKEKFKKSAEGKKRKRNKKRLSNHNLTPTKQRTTKYHRRVVWVEQ